MKIGFRSLFLTCVNKGLAQGFLTTTHSVNMASNDAVGVFSRAIASTSVKIARLVTSFQEVCHGPLLLNTFMQQLQRPDMRLVCVFEYKSWRTLEVFLELVPDLTSDSHPISLVEALVLPCFCRIFVRERASLALPSFIASSFSHTQGSSSHRPRMAIFQGWGKVSTSLSLSLSVFLFHALRAFCEGRPKP